MKPVLRGLTKRCPHCGASGLFSGWWTMHKHCPGCGMKFERDQGYGTGAMIVNTAVTIGTFLIVFVAIMVVTWPDVPWSTALIVTMVVNTLIPIVFYPWSKTIFLGLDLAVRPLGPDELARATAWLAQNDSPTNGIDAR
ncbi:MAG: DUF983 domain-containing protein [Acidimicrobiia bacterium]|nr:DUF983 domain-containing protein [Acidimicrobiia bacterium]